MSNMLPPDLMAALGGGGAPPAGPPAGPGGPPPMGAPVPPDAGGEPAGDAGSTVDILKQMIDLANQYIGAETDEVDKHTMAKVLTTLQQYLADEQREQDDALAGKVSPRLLRKTSGGPAA